MFAIVMIAAALLAVCGVLIFHRTTTNIIRVDPQKKDPIN